MAPIQLPATRTVMRAQLLRIEETWPATSATITKTAHTLPATAKPASLLAGAAPVITKPCAKPTAMANPIAKGKGKRQNKLSAECSCQYKGKTLHPGQTPLLPSTARYLRFVARREARWMR